MIFRYQKDRHLKSLKAWLFILATAVMGLAISTSYGQQPDKREILIHGTVIQDKFEPYQEVLIINTRTRTGIWAGMDGQFTIKVQKRDTIQISVRGYRRVMLSFADSTYRPEYHVTVKLEKLQIRIEKPVVIYPEVTAGEIEEKQQAIDVYDLKPAFPQPMDALQSPITALYIAFSKREREKREYYRLLQQDAVREAVKSAVRFFIQSELFYIPDDEIDQFVGWCNLPMEFVRKATLYELGTALKDCAQRYSQSQQY